MTFHDHFSKSADQYCQFRPSYPETLHRYLASISPDKQIAWDCATGNGQVALGLASFFKQVIASDASHKQVAQAPTIPPIQYTVCLAEQTHFANETISFISVAQALHWFNLESFFTESERILKPNGILAAWTYNLLQVSPETDQVINILYFGTLRPYWAKERLLVEEGYRNIDFPFKQINPPCKFEISLYWTVEEFIGYLKTWSAVKNFEQKNHQNPIDAISNALRETWGNECKSRKIYWPLSLNLRQK